MGALTGRCFLLSPTRPHSGRHGRLCTTAAAAQRSPGFWSGLPVQRLVAVLDWVLIPSGVYAVRLTSQAHQRPTMAVCLSTVGFFPLTPPHIVSIN